MFVGEAPGEEDDEQGRPFVGRAGQLLDRMIGAMKLTESEVYIGNVIKCRPLGTVVRSRRRLSSACPTFGSKSRS